MSTLICMAVRIAGIKSRTMDIVDTAKDHYRQNYEYLIDEILDESYNGNEFILENI